MKEPIYDIVTLVGNSETEIEHNASLSSKQLAGTIKETMNEFMASEVAKREGFKIHSIAQSQSFNPKKNVADVTITIALSFFGEEHERPSQRFTSREKLADRETSKFPTKAPAVRQPETQVPMAPSAMPQRASTVPQVRTSANTPIAM